MIIFWEETMTLKTYFSEVLLGYGAEALLPRRVPQLHGEQALAHLGVHIIGQIFSISIKMEPLCQKKCCREE